MRITILERRLGGEMSFSSHIKGVCSQHDLQGGNGPPSPGEGHGCQICHCWVSPPWILDRLDGKQQAEPNSSRGMLRRVKGWNLQKLSRRLLYRSLASSPRGRENLVTLFSRDPCPAPQNLRIWYDAWQEGIKFAGAIKDDNHLTLT